MSQYGPLVRIILRYIIGPVLGMVAVFVFGMQPDEGIGKELSENADMVALGCLVVGAIVEWFYRRAKKDGGAT